MADMVTQRWVESKPTGKWSVFTSERKFYGSQEQVVRNQVASGVDRAYAARLASVLLEGTHTMIEIVEEMEPGHLEEMPDEDQP